MATILYVDDNVATLRAIDRLLTERGFVVLTADSSDEGLRVLEKHPEVDLLLVDYHMPPTNGPYFVVRARVLKPDVKVLFYSGYELIDTPENVVMKDGNFDRLLERIQELLAEP